MPGSLDYTTPLFAHENFYTAPHDEHVTSATGTFVKYGGRYFVVTCSHVLGAVSPTAGQTLSMVADRVVINLSHITPGGIVPSFRVPRAGLAEADIDVAISRIDHLFEVFASRKHKKAVDLDDWIEPSWPEIVNAKACGWLNNYKVKTDEDQIATQGVEVVADLASSVGPEGRVFTMYGEKAENAETLLSGISGGVVVCLQREEEVPFGIVFEGYPSEPSALELSEDRIAQRGDVIVRGHVLTPTVFRGWLERAS